jgi:DNA-binding NarL/FixJ family response regulator
MILDSAKRMGTLIPDWLAFSRIGRAKIKKAAANLELLVRKAVAEIGRDTKGRDIVNLLSNAVKFTCLRKPAEIEIDSANHNTGEMKVLVRDNGAGFDTQYANKLFGVFQRVHLSEAFEGTGIGLKLPIAAGLEVLPPIKPDARLKMIPVMMLTSSQEEEDIMRSDSLGVNAYGVKPVDFHEFVSAVKEFGVFWTVIHELPPGSVKQ